MIQWLRRRFVAGFFVLVPVVVSLAALIWVFGVVDGITAPLYTRYFKQYFGADPPPGLGIVTTALLILMVGAFATNVLGKRLLQRLEGYLIRIPVFRTVYAPVKQLVLAFSPDNEYGFKRVVMIRSDSRGYILGFLTKEFSIQAGGRTESLIAVYVPTNHLYLGDVFVYPRAQASFPNVSVEEGIRIFLTGGMALPNRLTSTPYDHIDDKT